MKTGLTDKEIIALKADLFIAVGSKNEEGIEFSSEH